jgi:hypothetical protein
MQMMIRMSSPMNPSLMIAETQAINPTQQQPMIQRLQTRLIGHLP